MKRSDAYFGRAGLIAKSVVAVCCAWVSLVHADIYRCDTTPGVITLSNIQKDQNCKKMILPPIEKRAKTDTASSGAVKSTDAANGKASKTKSNYENAQGERKRIIQEELELEQDRLDAVNAKIANLNNSANKSATKAKDLAALEKKQKLHQGNIDLLQKELKKQ